MLWIITILILLLVLANENARGMLAGLVMLAIGLGIIGGALLAVIVLIALVFK